MKNISKLIILQLFAAALLFSILSSCQNKTATDSKEGLKNTMKPNFLVIIADDAGWNDFSFNGSEINTPTLDSLAQSGLKLDRFYTYPTCSPARASFLTGRPASRMGIVAPISGRSELSLPDTIKTLPQSLKELKYKTALMGKWHLGLNSKNGPEAYGFETSYGFLHGQLDQYAHTYKNGDSTWYKNGKFIAEEGHVTDLLTNAAIEYIKEQDSYTPFYLQLAYSAPHIPLQEPKLWLDEYPMITDNSRKAYAAAMSHMDDGIGRVLKSLKDQNILNNTIILFISDNGAQQNWIPSEELYDGKYGPNLTLGSNLPLRDYKTSNYEGAIRVPAIISWKNHLDQGESENYIQVTDWMPTFLKWAGATQTPITIEGEAAQALLSLKLIDRSNPIYIRGHLQECLIKKPYKLIRTRRLEGEPSYALYDIQKDPSETNNLSTSNTEKLKELQDLLNTEFSKDTPEVNVELRDYNN
tara:strand:- start:1284 stop:2693 length:1410 start_codon:yes stop_codon:yes gene_type:complete